jgi:hypothetical protein
MSQAGFKPMISVFEQSKDCAATGTGIKEYTLRIKYTTLYEEGGMQVKLWAVGNNALSHSTKHEVFKKSMSVV